jgi:hypothetical protein
LLFSAGVPGKTPPPNEGSDDVKDADQPIELAEDPLRKTDA